MDYYIAKKDNNYYLPVFGTKIVPNSDYTATDLTSYTTVGTYTWTCPAGVTKVRVIMSGGGGGGGGAWATTYYGVARSGHKGEDGTLITQDITVVPGRTYTIVVGAGGAGGSRKTTSESYYGAAPNGQKGGNSSFGDYSAPGGEGGEGGSYDSEDAGQGGGA